VGQEADYASLIRPAGLRAVRQLDFMAIIDEI
jgi:hypothetical protein